MGTHSGTKAVTNGLTHLFDASSVDGNPWKHNRSNAIPSWLTWSSGTGGTTGYGANGSASEQNRFWNAGAENDVGNATPFNPTQIAPIESLWITTPDATSGADGGWNTSYYNIDRKYTYRWSVWVKRHTSGTGGTFYMGMQPAPIRNDNGALQSNPYFTYPSQSSLTFNVWYLVVGHCFYEGYTGGRHPDSGWYELKTNSSLNGNVNARFLEKIPDKSYGNIGTEDCRWDSSTTSAAHRTYHYYTTNVNSGLTFAYPRLDKCDGTEPSIGELCTNAKASLKNLVGTDGHMGVRSHAAAQNLSYGTEGGTEYIRYSGSNVGAAGVMLSQFNYTTTDCTVVAVTRYAPGSSTRGRIVSGFTNNWLLGHHSNTTGDFYAGGWVRNNSTTNTDWAVYTATCQVSSDTYSFWVNGDKLVTNSTAGSQGPNGLSLFHYDPGNSEWTNGDLNYLAVYNRVLSDSEVKQVYASLKGRLLANNVLDDLEYDGTSSTVFVDAGWIGNYSGGNTAGIGYNTAGNWLEKTFSLNNASTLKITTKFNSIFTNRDIRIRVIKSGVDILNTIESWASSGNISFSNNVDLGGPFTGTVTVRYEYANTNVSYHSGIKIVKG